MLILAIILFGMITGAAAQLLLGRSARGIDWTLRVLRRADRLLRRGPADQSDLRRCGPDLKASGLIGSIIGAVIVTAGWLWFKRRSGAATT